MHAGKTILLVCNASWYLKNFRADLLSQLAPIYKLHVLIPDKENDSFFKNLQIETHYFNLDRKGLNPIKDSLSLFQLIRLFIKLRPDLVINFTLKPNIYGGLAATLLGIKYINNITGLGTAFLSNKLLNVFVLMLYYFSHKKCARVIFQNNQDLNLLTSKGVISQKQSILIQGSGVNTDNFKPMTAEQKFDFLMISRALVDKGIREYFQATKELKKIHPNLRFALAGGIDTGNRSAITQEEVLSNQHIEYLGHQEDMVSLINQTKCIVLPSYREGLSRTLLEAGACGKIAVASNVAGCNDVIIHGFNGFLCQVKDAADLKIKMLEVINLKQDQLELMQNNAREHVLKNFSSKIIVKKTMELINSL